MFHSRFRAVVIAAAFVLAAVVFIRLSALAALRAVPLPEKVVVAFFLPAAAVGIVAIIRRVSAVEPFRANYARFRGTFELLLDLTVVLIVGLQLTLHAWILFFRPAGGGRRLWLIPMTLVGFVLIILGNVLPRLRPNSTMGIRTPWTLRDERTWTRVHRAGGYLLVVFGLALLAVSYLDFQKALWVALPGLVLTLGGLPLFSYLVWRSGRRQNKLSAS